MSLPIECTNTYAEIFHINAMAYDITITSETLSKRAYNALKRVGVSTVSQLLEITPFTLNKVRNIERKTVEEIEDFLKSITESDVEEDITRYGSDMAGYLRDYIISEDFSFADQKEIQLVPKPVLQKYLEAEDLLGRDLIVDIVKNPLYGKCLTESLGLFFQKTKLTSTLRADVRMIPSGRRQMPADSFACFYNSIINNQLPMTDRFTSLQNYILSAVNVENKRQMISFARWCQYDVQSEVESFFASKVMLKSGNRPVILRGRANGTTLEELGQMFGCTRERIRQIEAKVAAFFRTWAPNRHLIEKVGLDNGILEYVPVDVFSQNCGQYAEEMVYLYKAAPLNGYIYSSAIQAFLLTNNENIDQEIALAVKRLPKYMRERAYKQYTNGAS